MPYKLRKAPNRDLYWVVGADGTKHSRDPLPLDVAKRQMTALNIAHARKSGAVIPPPTVTMGRKDFVAEHRRLTRLLAAVERELKKQRGEL